MEYDFWKNVARNIWAGFKDGFIQGIINTWSSVSPWLSWFIAMVQWIFGVSSPSTVFEGIGENLMMGLSKGIENLKSLPEMSMNAAITQVITPAMMPLQAATTTNNQTVNNFNMNINTQARAEPIMADFEMMRSFAGGG